MYRDRDRDTSNGMAVGLISGAVIGAGIALLLAPKTGRALRSDLSKGVDDLREAIGSYFEQLTDQAGERFESARAAVDKATQDVENAGRAFVESATDTIRSAADA